MNIYAQRGHKVVYLDENGYEWQRNHAREHGLVKGQVYEVSYTEVHSSRTDVKLDGIESTHNSVMFEDYVDPADTKKSEVDIRANGRVLVVETEDDYIEVSIDKIKELFNLVEKPQIKTIEEKVFAGDPVYYQLDVPVSLENVWHNRKHCIEVTLVNWNDFKNGNVNQFLY